LRACEHSLKVVWSGAEGVKVASEISALAGYAPPAGGPVRDGGSTLLWPEFPETPTAEDESALYRWGVRAVALASLLATAAYLVWRVTATMSHASPWLAIPLYVFEVYGFVNFLLFTFELWRLGDGVRVPVPSHSYQVAVLVPTYNESREILLPTVAAAVAMHGPHETWVLDDGHRPWVAEMAAQLGAEYRARTNPTHAKAGNINAVLDELAERGIELVAIFDADHVAKATFLERLIGYFNDDRVALVQTPQDYYNLNSFEHVELRRGGRFGEQELFFRMLSAARNRHNSAFWCGTGAILRLSALRAVGGAATETVTEDMHTTMRMHQAGWCTVYHNEVLARGLASSNWEQFQTQRTRWATGGMQILRSDNPLAAKGLSLGQRLSYFGGLVAWFQCWRNLMFILVPLATVFSGALPLAAPVRIFVPFWLITQVLERAAQRLLSRGTAPMWQSLVFATLRMPIICLASLALLSTKPRTFKVTPKGRDGEARSRMRAPLLLSALMVASALGLLWFASCMLGLVPLHYGHPGAELWASCWMVVNGMTVVAAVRRIRDERFAPDRRSAFRFEVPGDIQVDGRPAPLRDLSLNGAQVLMLEGDVTVGEWVTVSIPCAVPPVELPAVVRSARPQGPPSSGFRPRVVQAGFEFVDADTLEVARLAVALFRTGASITVDSEVPVPARDAGPAEDRTARSSSTVSLPPGAKMVPPGRDHPWPVRSGAVSPAAG
jgi:cellulose synthase (UDP-forming)